MVLTMPSTRLFSSGGAANHHAADFYASNPTPTRTLGPPPSAAFMTLNWADDGARCGRRTLPYPTLPNLGLHSLFRMTSAE